MDAEAITTLLSAIRDAVSSRGQKDDDVALPVFDPDRNDCGAATWCNSVEALSKELQWSSLKTAAKAGKALKGSSLTWFETWEPTDGRSWENLKRDITDVYPEKKNLSEKLSRAVSYTSDSAESYGEYAREKLRLFRNTKVAFTEAELIELVCGGIADVDIKMASLNNGVTSTSALIALLSTYAKCRKRTSESNIKDYESGSGPSGAKRPRQELRKCFNCNQTGHVQSQCRLVPATSVNNQAPQVPKPNDSRIKTCTYCKKVGHLESICFLKQRALSNSNASITLVPSKEANFLDKRQ